MKKIVSALCAIGCATVASAGGNATNSTAQSVMFDTKMPDSFLITDTETWSFQPEVAATFFTNAWDGVAPVGQPQGPVHGTVAPQPPPAPAPIDQKLTGSINGNSCVFFNGGILAALGDSTYAQSLAVDVPYSLTTCNKQGKCTTTTGVDTYKFTYGYVIAPNVLAVEARTAWQKLDTVSGAVTATLTGNVAAETTVKKAKGNDPWTFKTGFGLPDAVDPLTGQFIGLQNIVATLTDEAGTTLDQRILTNTILHNVDFYYAQNAGYNGPFPQLVDNAWVSAIQSGQASASDGSRDDFAGNNGSLGDLAVLDPASFTIERPGKYTLTITGTLQGVAGVLPLTFGVAHAVAYDFADHACPVVVP